MNAAIIVAGGSGERVGLDGGKQLARIADRPVLFHTLAAFDSCASVDEIVVVVHPDRIAEYLGEAIEPVGSAKVTAVVGGGPTRQASVAAGLAATPAHARTLLIHDGARPMITPAIISQAVAALDADDSLDGVVVGHPAYDTLKTVDERLHVTGTPDRSIIWVAQTPQVFRATALRGAYTAAAASGYIGTDDASIVEHAGGAIGMIAGPRDNIKNTVPEDLLMAEKFLAARVGEESDG
jgi:2-C-methyl-D-erythritol 4-phosphate cytidylyltransferase